MARLAVFDASLRTDCASAQIATTFDLKKNLRALKTDTSNDRNMLILECDSRASSSSHTLKSTCCAKPVAAEECSHVFSLRELLIRREELVGRLWCLVGLFTGLREELVGRLSSHLLCPHTPTRPSVRPVYTYCIDYICIDR
jgi:hypothetical protein